MKHTPPPWLYRGKSSTVHRPCDTHPYGEQIFGFHDVEFDDRTPSDADLAVILAAPRLLEALEGAERCVRQLAEQIQSESLRKAADYYAEVIQSSKVISYGK